MHGGKWVDGAVLEGCMGQWFTWGTFFSLLPSVEAAGSVVADWRNVDDTRWKLHELEEHLTNLEMEAIRSTYVAQSDQ